MMKQISFPFSENNNKQLEIIKTLFFNGNVEKIRKKVKIEGINIPKEQYSINNQYNYTSEKFKDFLFVQQQDKTNEENNIKCKDKILTQEISSYKQIGSLTFYTNNELVKNSQVKINDFLQSINSNNLVKRIDFYKEILVKSQQKSKEKLNSKKLQKRKPNFYSIEIYYNIFKKQQQIKNYVYYQKKTKKVVSSEPATLLDSLESKRERKKKGRWNKVKKSQLINQKFFNKRDENDVSSDEGYQQIIESSEEENNEEEQESELKIIFPKFNNIIKINDLPQPFSLTQFKFYPKVIYDMHYNISITKLPKNKKQEQLLLFFLPIFYQISLRDNLVWVIEDFYNFAQVALETQNNFELMSEKLGKTHYDIRILHEFIDKAPIKLNDYTREWRRKKANKTEIISSAKINIKNALKTIFDNFADEKKLYEPSFPFDQRIVSLKQLAIALRRYQYEYSYEKIKGKK